MDLDLSGMWTWAFPLWSLIILIFFLIGVKTQDVIYQVHIGGGATGGGGGATGGGGSRPPTKTHRVR